MTDTNDATHALKGLATTLGFDADEHLIDATLRLEDVKAFLVPRIAEMLNRNPAHLMSILYRVDVAEPRVQQVLQQSPPERIPHDLADLLIERQLQKVRMRRQYAQKTKAPPENKET